MKRIWIVIIISIFFVLLIGTGMLWLHISTVDQLQSELQILSDKKLSLESEFEKKSITSNEQLETMSLKNTFLEKTLEKIIEGPVEILIPEQPSYKDWKIYQNKAYSFEIKYPNQLNLTDANESTSGKLVYLHSTTFPYVPLDVASEIVILFKDKMDSDYYKSSLANASIVAINDQYFYKLPEGGGNKEVVYIPFDLEIAIKFSSVLGENDIQLILYSLKKIN